MLVKLLRPNRPDDSYLEQVFKHTRQMLEVNVEKSRKRLPELLSDTELAAFYEAVWKSGKIKFKSQFSASSSNGKS